MAAPVFTPLPTTPNRETSPETFSTDADAFLGALPTFQTEGNTLGTYCETQAGAALTSANTAAASAASAGAVLWVSGTSYAVGYVVYSPINYQNYRCIVSTSGTTDPSLDGVNWTYIGGNLSIDDNATSTAVTIDASGNVGIGTTAPPSDALLTLAGAQGTTQSLYFSGFGADFDAAISHSNAALIFANGGNNTGVAALTERMRIDSSGNVLVGTTVPYNGLNGISLEPRGVIGVTATSEPAAIFNRGTSDGSLISFRRSNTQSGSISITTTSTAYNTTSDYRLKENITPVQGAADIVKAMRPCTYTFKADSTDWHDGFLAHELQELHPRAVIGSKDAMVDEEYEVTPAVLDEEGNVVTEAVMGTRSVPDYQGVDYSKLTPILTAALQEALNKIDALEARLTTLEAV